MRAIQRARQVRANTPPPAEAVAKRFTTLLQPAIASQEPAYRAAGLRHRKLGLQVMIARVLDLIWRQLGSLREAGRTVRREGALGLEPVVVSQQAVVARLASFPSRFVLGGFQAMLPTVQALVAARSRCLSPVLRQVAPRFAQIVAADGCTLDGLLRKLGLLRGAPSTPLAGRIMTMLDVLTQLPIVLDYTAVATASDQQWWPGCINICLLTRCSCSIGASVRITSTTN